MVLKLGEAMLRRIRLVYHHPHEGLVFLGKTSFGTPVYTNKLFQEADLKIGIGSLTPHDFAGFGGGGKIVAIGLAGIDTLYHDHVVQAHRFKRSVAVVDGNDCQSDIREMAEMVGLDFLVNAVPSRTLQSLAIECGAFHEVHERCVQTAREAWQVALGEPDYDIAVLNAYPKDIDLIQSFMALNVCLFPRVGILKEGGIAVLTTPAPDGAATHSLGGIGCRGHEIPSPNVMQGRTLAVFSPGLNRYDIEGYFPSGTRLFNCPEQMLRSLSAGFHGPRRVAVFHCASMQWIGNESPGEQVSR